jgi:hypothetical protein
MITILLRCLPAYFMFDQVCLSLTGNGAMSWLKTQSGPFNNLREEFRLRGSMENEAGNPLGPDV